MMDNQFFEKAHELWSKGIPFVTAQVVRAEKPTSAKPGDKAIVTAQGELFGWVGGLCAQPTVIKEAAKALSDGQPRFIRLSNAEDAGEREGLLDMPMTCLSQGALEIYIEPQHPALRLMIIGRSPIARKLAELGKVMDYHVIAVDLDSDGTVEYPTDEVLTNLDNISDKVTPLTYIVIVSHGNYDELALQHVLTTNAAYIALVTSKTRAEAARDFVIAQGVTDEQFNRLKFPAGLDIQARQNDEIALSIIAEIVQKRREPKTIDVDALLDEVSSKQPEPVVAIDPVCGMEVNTATAKYTSEYAGQTVYFCNPGCKMHFDENPENYMSIEPPSGIAIDPVCGMEVEIATAEHMSEHEGEIYYFCCGGCKGAFEKVPHKYAERAKKD